MQLNRAHRFVGRQLVLDSLGGRLRQANAVLRRELLINRLADQPPREPN